MRDRLIELINKVLKEQFDFVPLDKAIKVADALLADGVIVPPCKIGDMVYQVIGHYDYIRECEVVGYHLGEFSDLRGHKRKPYLICRSDSSHYLSHLDIDKIGKTVFLTREEAEAARIAAQLSNVL